MSELEATVDTMIDAAVSGDDRGLIVMAACLLAQPLLRDMFAASAKITDPEAHAEFIGSTYESVATICVAFARTVVSQVNAQEAEDGAGE